MKTTKKDFELFKSACREAAKRLGITDWSIHYDHSLLENEYARTYWKLSAGVATVVFSTYWDDLRPKTEEEIKKLALHETLHILMAPLVAEAGERYTNQLAIDTAEHLIIRRLENIVE